MAIALGEETFVFKIGGQTHRLRGTFAPTGDPVPDGSGNASVIFELKTVMLCGPHDINGHHPLRPENDPTAMPRLDNTLSIEASPGVFRDVEWWQTVAKTPTTRSVYEYRLPGTGMTVFSDDVPNYGECYGYKCERCGNDLVMGYLAQVGAERRIRDAFAHFDSEHVA